MNMHEFQRLTLATLPMMAMKDHLSAGMIALNDSVEDAAALYARMEKAENADEYIEAREDLGKAMGFVLAAVAQVCEGLDVIMDEVAMENIENLLGQKADAKLEEQEKGLTTMGLLRSIFELAGKAVQSDE